MIREYQQCTRCVMDTGDPDISFNEKGHCNHCTEFLEKTAQLTYQGKSSDEELVRIVLKIKEAGKKNDYDCLLGISGGIDSCYAAYILRKLGLRVLAVHLDNGWNSEEAVNNIKKICRKLGIDYQSYVLDWEQFKDLQLAFLKASIVEMEIPTDVAIPGALHKIASENKIKYIISGGNYATEGILPQSWFYNAKDLKLLKAINKKFGSGNLKSFPVFDYKQEMYYKFIKGIKTIYLLNYVPYAKNEAMQLLEKELEWKYYGGKHYESKFTGFVQSYIQPVKFNADYRKATFSTQICTGEITRDQALEELKKPSFDPVKIREEKKYISKKLSLSEDEFEAIMALPVKSYRDYPNDQQWLEFVYSVYRKIFS